jgi:nucleoside-diphosphate-sugar epimerase
MAVVVVAGGLGDLGRNITDALFESGKHEVYVMSRTVRNGLRNAISLIILIIKTQIADDSLASDLISPLSGKGYRSQIQTDYSSEDALLEQLTAKRVDVVICAFPMDSDTVCNAQLRLIRAADRCPTVKRFIPSEFNVEYDAGDDVLPYPEKRFHLMARQELAKTPLEYAYIYTGMFSDYFALPRVQSTLRPLVFCVDAESGQAVLPGDGEGRMSMTFTRDFARYLVLALELDKWPRIMTTVTSTVSMNELVKIYEKSLGRKLEVRYQPVEKLLKHETIDLPVNVTIAKQFPNRFPQGIRGIIADLEACVALGGYDMDKWNLGDHLDLVKTFEGKVPAPKLIEDLIEEAWNPPVSQRHLGAK